MSGAPVNVEDCLTASRALATGVAEEVIKRQNIVTGFAVIGGVAVAALTRKLAHDSKGITTFINVENVLLRQTKMNVDLEIGTKDLPKLWAELGKLGYLPNGAQDPVHAPGGYFLATSAKYKLDRSKDSHGNSRSGKWLDVFFDVRTTDSSRLLAFANKADIFKYITPVQIDSYTVKIPCFTASVVLLMKVDAAADRGEQDESSKDLVDVGILLNWADKLGITKASLEPFRSHKPDAKYKALKVVVDGWAAHKQERAAKVVKWMLEQKYISSSSKAAAETAWQAFFVQLSTIF